MSSVLTGPSRQPLLLGICPSKAFAGGGFRDPLLNEAESLLVLARSTLKDRRYEEAIIAAREAYQKIMDSSR
jgi:hypothetical protein